MSVHVSRNRGGIWYARGTVKVGKESRIIPEYSTGCASRADAEAEAARRDREVRDELLGMSGRVAKIFLSDCFLAYYNRPGGIRPHDVSRIREFNEIVEDKLLVDAVAAWQAWIAVRGLGQKPTSVTRWRSTFQAAINYGAMVHNTVAPKPPGIKGGSGSDRLMFLTDSERKALLASYNPHASCPILVLAYQGMRTQEVLQLDWRQINFARKTIYVPGDQTKSRKARTMPLHGKVDALLFGLWSANRQPERGPVFISAKGKPYADTRGRDERAQGGNPLSQAHLTACEKAGVTGFRVHDWRHDWAARMVMKGTDLRTLMDLGGWASLRMVQRYTAVSSDHMLEAISRLD
jgi:integrase